MAKQRARTCEALSIGGERCQRCREGFAREAFTATVLDGCGGTVATASRTEAAGSFPRHRSVVITRRGDDERQHEGAPATLTQVGRTRQTSGSRREHIRTTGCSSPTIASGVQQHRHPAVSDAAGPSDRVGHGRVGRSGGARLHGWRPRRTLP
jgi:hypothetical protein